MPSLFLWFKGQRLSLPDIAESTIELIIADVLVTNTPKNDETMQVDLQHLVTQQKFINVTTA